MRKSELRKIIREEIQQLNELRPPMAKKWMNIDDGKKLKIGGPFELYRNPDPDDVHYILKNGKRIGRFHLDSYTSHGGDWWVTMNNKQSFYLANIDDFYPKLKQINA